MHRRFAALSPIAEVIVGVLESCFECVGAHVDLVEVGVDELPDPFDPRHGQLFSGVPEGQNHSGA